MPVNLYELETLAREKLSEMVYGYYVSGANDQLTLEDNRRAYDRIRLLPRVLRGVADRNTRVTILNTPMPYPIMIAPMGFMAMGHPDGELAVVRAAGERDLTMTLSTMSTYSLEDVAQAASAPLWFQLYVYKDRVVTQQLVQRAEAAGYTALVVTVDTPLLGRREADIRTGFHVPDGLQAANLIHESMRNIDSVMADSGLAAYIASLWHTNLNWEDIDWLASITRLPILLKGILHPDDARLAIEHGAAGVIVSNHGGRQLDTSPATIDALPAVVDAVGDETLVLIDGGIRRGTDIVKALALGARGVLLGRPVLWGLAHDGQAGVAHVLDLLLDEFSLAMALCGCRSLEEINQSLIFS